MEFNANNPFLVDLLDVENGAAQQPAQQLLHQQRAQRCKLPEFWPNNPVLWFARAEFNFEVAGVVTEREQFMHTANALPYDALTLVADLVTQPPVVQPYQRLKERLLLSHQLTAVQMAEKIYDMPELGDRRPSQLLAAMMEFCPEGEVHTAFFRAAFLRRLPKEIRVLLADEVRGDLKDLAIRADELHQHHKSATVAMLDTAVDAELAEAVAALAVKSGKGKFNNSSKKTSNNSGGGSGGAASSGSGFSDPCCVSLKAIVGAPPYFVTTVLPFSKKVSVSQSRSPRVRQCFETAPQFGQGRTSVSNHLAI